MPTEFYISNFALFLLKIPLKIYKLQASPKLDLLSAPDFILFIPMITQGRVNFEDYIIPIGGNTKSNWGAVQ